MIRRRLIVRSIWAIVAAVFAVISSGIPASSAPTGFEQIGRLDVSTPEGTGGAGDPNKALIFDPARRRAFQLILFDSKRTVLRRWSLDTRRVDLERDIPRTSMPRGPAPAGSATEWLHTYDPASGTLFFPYLDANLVNFGGILAIDGDTLSVVRNYPRTLVNVDTNVDPSTVGCTSAACLPQQPTANANIFGMSFVPSILSGGQPKILMLLQEPKAPGIERNVNVVYVIQWDLDSGRQDFNYRVQACGHNLPSLGYFPIGLFQARLTAGIYLGCLAAGGTGQIVRIDLDLNGKPSAEAAYPGPLGVFDVIADEESDRMLLRVSNTEGQSWWVFDGSSKSYTGVAGVTIGPGKTASGMDPLTGRLYVMAPPTAAGDQRNDGGLMYTDVRRSPVPQMLTTEEFAQPAAGRIAIDVHPVTGERRVYVRKAETSTYLIFRDGDAFLVDESVNDEDSRTSDVEERTGVTGRTFNGSGHAYGFRTLQVGGLNGTVPTGPDVSDIRPGRAATIIAGTPCGTGDREIVLGAVKNAALSNNLSAASSAVAEADAGTKQDLNEPTGRCYPRPQDNSGGDIWSSSGAGGLSDYPRPFDTEIDEDPTSKEGRSDADEFAGSGWPFTTAECSGDLTQKSPTLVMPLHRGDPDDSTLPEDIRDSSVPMTGYEAEVACNQSKARVDAYAQMLVREEKTDAIAAPLPGIGTLRVGEVTSRISIYLDPARGLVTRSEATARAISIGDRIHIDEATSVGEAWAKGRSGTAGTSFFRRICGVWVADPASDTHIFRPVIEPDTATPVDPSDPTKPPRVPASPKVEPSGGPEVQKSVDVQPCGDLGQQATTNANLDPEKPVIDAINRVLGSRGRITAPKPDGPLSQGSPGGYLASVQKDRLEAISSRAVNSDSSTQVPALELLVYNDDPTKGRGRQLYQFAGVDASVTYGIYLLNPGGNPPPPCFCPPPPSGGLLDPPIDDTPIEDPGPGAPDGPLGPITMLFSGINFLLRSPRDAALAAAIWALLYSPIQLAGRRRALRSLV